MKTMNLGLLACIFCFYAVIGNGQAQTTYSWNATSAQGWGNATNWSPNGTPGSADTIGTPLQLGSLRPQGNRTVAGVDVAIATGTSWVWQSSGGGNQTWTIGSGGVTRGSSEGGGNLNFDGFGAGTTTIIVNGNVTVNKAGVAFGTFTSGASNRTLSGLTISGSSSVNASSYLGVAMRNGSIATLGQVSLAGATNGGAFRLGTAAGETATIQVAGLTGPGNTVTSMNTSGTTGTSTLNFEFTQASGSFNYSGNWSEGSTGSYVTLTNIRKTGGGSQVLSGANTYTGNTTISAGTLQFAKTASLYNGTTANWTASKISVESGATAAFNVGGVGEFSTGNVTTLLTNLGGLGGAVSNNGLRDGATVAFDTTNASGSSFTISDNIANSTGAGGGAISLSKIGSGTLVLSGSNAYTGSTTVNAGTLAVNGSIATSSHTTINSGAVLIGSGTIGALIINSGGTINPGNGPGTLTVGDTTWNGGGNYNWQIHNATGTAGTGWDLLSSTGTLTIGATSGDKFQINLWSLSTLSPDTNGTPFNFNAASNFSWNIASFSSISGFEEDKFQIVTTAVNGTGGFIGFTGTFSLSSNGTALTLNYTAPSSTGIWTAGSGNWTVAGNWQSGSVPSNGSPLEFSGAGGTSTNNNALTSINGLAFAGNSTGSYAVDGNALAIGALGIVNNSSYAQTTALDLALSSAQSFSAAAANLTVSGAVGLSTYNLTAMGNQTLSIQGAISGSGALVREGNGILILSANNTYTGGTSLNAGTIRLEAANSLSTSGNITFAGGSLEYSSGISSDLSARIKNSSADITIDTGTNTPIYASDIDSSNIGGLLKIGSGTLVLTANNTYTGTTTINAGTLQLGNNGTAGAVNGNIANNGSLVLFRSNNSTLSGAISGNGSFTKNGAGALGLSGSNTFTGGFTLLDGTLSLGSNSAIGTGTFTIAGGSIDVTAARTLTTNNTQSWSGDFAFVGTNTLSLGTGAITMNASRQVTVNASTLTVGGIIGDGGNGYGLTKTGAGTLRLDGVNTYTGATTINAGTLSFGTHNALSDSTSVVVNSGGTLNTDIRNDTVASLTVNGGSMLITSGNFTASGASSFINNGSVSYSAPTGRLNVNGISTLGNFTFRYDNAVNQDDSRGLVLGANVVVQDGAIVNFTNNSTGRGRIELNGNRTFTIGNGSSMNVSWVIDQFSSTSGLTKNGSGALVLSGSTAYSGTTVVNTGTLEAAHANALGSTPSVHVNGGSLLVSADDAINGKNLTLASTSTTVAGLVFSGSYSGDIGTLTLSANSIIDLGENNVVAHFAAIAGLNNYILKIYNWSGTTLWNGGNGNNPDQIYFGSGVTGNLDRISFYSDFGNYFLGNGYQIMGGDFANQVIPVPEPETWATAVLLLLAGSWFWKQQRKEKSPVDA